jgi:hypothetical protein
MIALRNYIKNKFDFTEKNYIEDYEEYITIDSGYSNGFFFNACISFNIDTKELMADIPTQRKDLKEAINILQDYFRIEEIHNHDEDRHIHIVSQLSKDKIDILAEILQ